MAKSYLIKQGKNKIDWTDFTFNPISGKCHHGCEYCYMNSLWKRFPKLAENKLRSNYLDSKMPENPSKIFVGSSTDMWGDWVPKEWIHSVFRKIRKYPQHIFQFLTKNPDRYWEFDFTEFNKNCWFGTTVDGSEKTKDNLSCLVCALDIANPKIFVSFEPFIQDIKITNEFKAFFRELDWIIIGADSTKGAKKPPKEWADNLINLAYSYNIPVWVKDNYNYPYVIKEFPGDR